MTLKHRCEKMPNGIMKKLIYARRVDASKEGHSKQAFRYVRGPSNPPVTEIQHTIEKDFLVVPLDEN